MALKSALACAVFHFTATPAFGVCSAADSIGTTSERVSPPSTPRSAWSIFTASLNDVVSPTSSPVAAESANDL